MPPKQATLGYVKSSQLTLGCMLRFCAVIRGFTDNLLHNRKFFKNPNGPKSKPQQSTLAFSTGQSSKSEKTSKPKTNNTISSTDGEGITSAEQDVGTDGTEESSREKSEASKGLVSQLDRTEDLKGENGGPDGPRTSEEEMKDNDGAQHSMQLYISCQHDADGMLS